MGKVRTGVRTIYSLVVAMAVLVGAGFADTAAAEQSASQNYMVTETQFGTGTAQDMCSDQYCAQASAGDTAVGLMESKNFIVRAGGATTDEPVLEVAASGGMNNLGTLDPGKTSTITMAVSVRTYLTGGYVVQINGDTPGFDAHRLTSMSEPSPSEPGVEQFGINLVANESPTVGANPVQVPSSDISFGEVASNYSFKDKFMYQEGDVIARSDKDSGRTDYTVSMIINISNITPRGWYTSVFSAVVVPIY